MARKTKTVPISFSKQFFEDHVGYLVSDPYLAIVELVANCYDAGATHVEIVSPSEIGQRFLVQDNGIGMTAAQFEHRWSKLSYSRVDEQGEEVVFPPGVKGIRRVALGRTGKGRHGAFCFADKYEIETHRDGEHTAAMVRLVRSDHAPFSIEPVIPRSSISHGTCIQGLAQRNFIVEPMLRELIGSKFLVDPSFSITLNGKAIDLFSLNIIDTTPIALPKAGISVTVHRIAPKVGDRDSQMRGVTWWVNHRMVGQPNWQSQSGEMYLDARKTEAKRYSFVVEADLLKPHVKEDWSGFHSLPVVLEARDLVDGHVREQLHDLLAHERKQSKIKAIQENAKLVGELEPISRRAIGVFVDEVQQRCPSVSERDLAKTVEIYAKLEHAKCGYDLLTQLAECTPEDLSTWNDLMKKWTATNAQIVLSELERRLSLISRISALIDEDGVDELHEIHPLFERGLWMFGPEFDSVDFCSNRGMTEIIRKFFGNKAETGSRRRPDIVAIPNSSISVYGAPSYDGNAMINGCRTVLIVELKTTGLPITLNELDQARNYCNELYVKKAVSESIPIRAYVLGSALDVNKELKWGEATVYPRSYRMILDNAHARTFNLQARLKNADWVEERDDVVEGVVSIVRDRT